MPVLIETLEDRRLCAADTYAALAADATQLRADLRSLTTTYHANAKLLAAEAKSLPKTAANRSLLAHVKHDQATTLAAVNAGARKLIASEGPTVRRLAADGLLVYRNPGNVADLAKLTADVATAEAKAAGPVAQVQTALTSGGTAVDTDLDALVAANPTDTALATDVQTSRTNGATARTALTTDVTQARTDLAALLASL